MLGSEEHHNLFSLLQGGSVAKRSVAGRYAGFDVVLTSSVADELDPRKRVGSALGQCLLVWYVIRYIQ